MAAKEIMECIKLKDKTYFLDKYLYPAMEEGYVEQLYPENPKHPKQKYMLTEKGKALLKQKDDKGSGTNNHCLCHFYYSALTSLPAHPAPRSCRIPDLRIIVNKE